MVVVKGSLQPTNGHATTAAEDVPSTQQPAPRWNEDEPMIASLRRNPRLAAIHDRHIKLALCDDNAGKATSSLSNEQRLWADAVERSMPTTAIALAGYHSDARLAALDVADEEKLKQLGRQRPIPTPTEPKPDSCRRSLPGGEPISAPKELLKQGEVFDAQHKARTKAAYHSLKSMMAQREDPDSTRDYMALLDDLKRSRFQLPTEVQVPAFEAAPKATHVKAEQMPRWRITESIWKERPKTNDSRSFFDTEAMFERAFCLDWSRALRSHRLAECILNNDDGDHGSDSEDDDDNDAIALDVEKALADLLDVEPASEDSAPRAAEDRGRSNIEAGEIAEVGNVMFQHRFIIYRAFDVYASLEDTTDISAGIGWNAYKRFTYDCGLVEQDSEYCAPEKFDHLFVLVNSKAIVGGRKGKDLILTAKAYGKYGQAVKEAVHHADTRSLCRSEWLNILVRIAVMKYISTGRIADLSHALHALLKEDIEAKLTRSHSWIGIDPQFFRANTCYTEAVDAVLCEHRESLRNIFNIYAATDPHNGLETVMSLHEFKRMLNELSIFDMKCSLRDATVVFMSSKLHVIDENSKATPAKLENLGLEDFYEALTRMAVTKALPTDEEILEAGALDAGDFILKLRDKSMEGEWYAAAYARRSSWNYFDFDHPPLQPAHRCLSHLILLMVRTIERHGNGVQDLLATKKELQNARSIAYGRVS